MEGYPGFHGYGYFGHHNEHQNASDHNGLYGSGAAEGSGFEGFCYEGGVDGSYLQPVPVCQSENGSAQMGFTTDFPISQSSSHTAFGFVASNESGSTWAPQEAIETHNWLSTSNVFVADANFRQGSNNGVGIAEPPVPPYSIQSPQIISPSTVAFQPLHNENVKPPVFALMQDFEPLPDGESGESLLYTTSNSGEIPPQKTNRATSSRFRSVVKQNLVASRFYCNIRPCSHERHFKRKADLERHLATQHSHLNSSEKKLCPCPWLDCNRKDANGFLRRDKMLQHQDRVHGMRLEGKGIRHVEKTGC